MGWKEREKGRRKEAVKRRRDWYSIEKREEEELGITTERRRGHLAAEIRSTEAKAGS
jgi:hypothetical protein